MQVDWIIAIGVFFVFLSTGFQYYFNFFQIGAQPTEKVVGDISDRITGFLKADVYDIPVIVDSQEARSDVLYLSYTWPSAGAKNSTRILKAGARLDCNLTGDSIYWQADLAVGSNNFTMRVIDADSGVNCTDAFSIENANKTIPWAGVKSRMISQSRVDEMMATEYPAFKSSLGINRDFRAYVNVSGNATAYGLNTPNATNFYEKETRWALAETGGEVIIRVLAW